MHKYKLTIEYDGTGYRGWQAQKNARSIQATLLEASENLFGEKVDVQGAGRTDAGVHALAQVAHIAAARKIHPQNLLEGLNNLLPASINVTKIEAVHKDFRARHDAKSRSYIYVLSRRRTAFGKKYVWWVKDRLDSDRMQAVMKLFPGFHDFASFADKRRDTHESSKVNLQSAELQALDDLLVFRIVGSHFLWKMVRRMVGVTVAAGKGDISPSDVKGMLVSFSELPAKLTAPSSGLFLECVLYEGDYLPPLRLPCPPFFRQR